MGNIGISVNVPLQVHVDTESRTHEEETGTKSEGLGPPKEEFCDSLAFLLNISQLYYVMGLMSKDNYSISRCE